MAEQTGVAEAPVPLRRPWWRQRWVLAAVAAALVVALAVPGALLVFGAGAATPRGSPWSRPREPRVAGR